MKKFTYLLLIIATGVSEIQSSDKNNQLTPTTEETNLLFDKKITVITTTNQKTNILEDIIKTVENWHKNREKVNSGNRYLAGSMGVSSLLNLITTLTCSDYLRGQAVCTQSKEIVPHFVVQIGCSIAAIISSYKNTLYEKHHRDTIIDSITNLIKNDFSTHSTFNQEKKDQLCTKIINTIRDEYEKNSSKGETLCKLMTVLDFLISGVSAGYMIPKSFPGLGSCFLNMVNCSLGAVGIVLLPAIYLAEDNIEKLDQTLRKLLDQYRENSV